MKIVSNQDREINTNMKQAEVMNHNDYMNFLIIKAINNIVKFTDDSHKDIFELISYDDIFKSINLIKIDDKFKSDRTYLQFQLDTYKVKYIRNIEYIIFSMLRDEQL